MNVIEGSTSQRTTDAATLERLVDLGMGEHDQVGGELIIDVPG